MIPLDVKRVEDISKGVASGAKKGALIAAPATAGALGGFAVGQKKGFAAGEKKGHGEGLLRGLGTKTVGTGEDARFVPRGRKSDPLGVSKGIGDWKTIGQREQTQRRDRKVMRRAGAGAGLSAGLAATVVARNPNALKGAERTVKATGNTFKISRKTGMGVKDSAKGAGRSLRSQVTAPGSSGGNAVLAGAAGVGAAGAAGGAAKGQHTYQQHKINSRRRDNAKKVSKMDSDPFGISKASTAGLRTPSITSMKKPFPKKQAALAGGGAAAVGGGVLVARKKRESVEKGLGDASKKITAAARRSGQAAKKGYTAAGNQSSNANSGSYVAGAAARKLRAPAALAGAGGAGYEVSQRKENRIYKGAAMHDDTNLDLTLGMRPALVEYISKADPANPQPKASAGRLVAGGAFGGLHGAVAGKKGKKLRATGNAAGGALGGGIVGGGAAALATRGRSLGAMQLGQSAGAVSGAIAGTRRNQRKGYLKPQGVSKSYGTVSPFGIEH